MRRFLKARSGACLVAAWLLLTATPSHAEEKPPSRPALSEFISSVMADHPSLQAAEAELAAAHANARAQSRPLYNPTLELGYENAESDTKDIGLAQTFDWAGKRGARAGVANAQVNAAEASLAITRKGLLAELLVALANYQTRAQLYALADLRLKLGTDFLALAERRHAAGDLPKTELLTARLALAEARAALNAAFNERSLAEQGLAAVVGAARPSWPLLSGEPPQGLPQLKTIAVQSLPELQLALAESQASRSRIRVAQKNRLPDPTLGVRGGQENSSTLVGVRLAVPLFVRNSFRAEVDVANADYAASQQGYNDLLRRVTARLAASHQRYLADIDAWQAWREQGAVPLEEQRTLIQRLWRAGEINAIDYLIQLNQSFVTENAAVELRGRLWADWFQWLDAANTVDSWLETLP
ncbi:MAG: TolC family protein [Pseudomonadota bacterium]